MIWVAQPLSSQMVWVGLHKGWGNPDRNVKQVQTPVTLFSGELWSILVVRLTHPTDLRSRLRHVCSAPSKKHLSIINFFDEVCTWGVDFAFCSDLCRQEPEKFVQVWKYFRLRVVDCSWLFLVNKWKLKFCRFSTSCFSSKLALILIVRECGGDFVCTCRPEHELPC